MLKTLWFNWERMGIQNFGPEPIGAQNGSKIPKKGPKNKNQFKKKFSPFFSLA
jgi:hypothetical protein